MTRCVLSNWRVRLAAFAIVVLASAHFVLGQKGKPTPPPAAPPVSYHLQLIEMPANQNATGAIQSAEMNRWGEFVGNYFANDGLYHAFLYDPAINPGQAIDLNELVAPWIPEGWYLSSAKAINDRGTIVGIRRQVGNETRRGFVLYRIEGQPVELVLLDDEQWPYTFPVDINEAGDLLAVFDTDGTVDGNGMGVYACNLGLYGDAGAAAIEILPFTVYSAATAKLNNRLGSEPAQVAGTLASGPAFRYTLGDALPEIFPEYDLYSRDEYSVAGINDAGAFCGRRIPKSHYEAFRYDGQLKTVTGVLNGASAVNLAGDMSIASGRQFYYEGVGLLNLDDLLVGDPDDISLWKSANFTMQTSITERGAVNPDSPNFPGLCGNIYEPVSGSPAIIKGYVLTPQLPSP